ncbi:MAG: prepilin-type N-terminal cleavage/methylation domain-containing protein [Syntrophobacterales bacterium]|nr:MAG: prepilin-type N-terminal cleavage/methylation domain-containing protein [Syntrophobacterales bacterium]
MLKYPPLTPTSGFTLLEVVISIGILLVILTIIYNTFNSSLKAYTEMETRGDAYAQARVVLNRIYEEIGSIYWSEDPKSNTGLVGGDEEEDDLPFDSLHFTSLSHVRWAKDSKESELCEIGYYLEKDGETGESFLFRREDWNVDGTLEEGGRPLELAEGIDGLNFRYYDGEEWVDDWDSKAKGGLPKAIEVVLIMGDPRQKRIAFSSIIPVPMAGR